MKRDLRAEIKEMYRTVPPMPNPDSRHELIARAGQIKTALPRESSILWFVKAQMRFMDVKFLVFQLLLICLYGVFVTTILKDAEGFLLLVPIAPIIVLIGTSGISQSFCYNMAELELPSRFSLPQVLLARLIITATIDMLSMTCVIVLTTMQTYTTLGALVLYGLVPCFCAALGSLFLINRCRNASVQYYVSAYCIALSALGAISVNTWPAWYDGTAGLVWLIVLIATIAGLGAEIYKMLHDCSKKLEGLKLR